MAANNFTTSSLIELIKLIAHVPQSQSTFLPAQILTLADMELSTAIARQLKDADEGYWQEIVEYEQNASGEYDVPAAAVASTGYSVQIRNGQAIWPVSRQEVAEMTTTTFPSVGNYSFFIRGNKINVLPAQFSGVLRITFERRPSKLVPVTSCAEITGIAGNVLTVGSLPGGWVVGNAVDLQQAQPQFGFLGENEIAAINGVDITLVDTPTNIVLGDYVCLQGQSCIPQIPVEFHQLLAQRVVCKIYESQGYLDKLNASKAVLKEMEDNLSAIITPRTQSAPKIVNPSWGGRKPGSSWARFNPPAGSNG